jgi:hypothetical protein
VDTFVRLQAFRNNDVPADTTYQLELGSTPTAYEPYTGNTYPITFPQEAGTVYGGALNVTTGVLTVDRAMVDLGTLSWMKGSTNASGVYRYVASIPTVIATLDSKPNMICSQYATLTPAQTYRREQGVSNNVNVPQVTLYDDAFKDSDATTFKTAMSGVQLVYELAEPIEIQLSANQINSLYGVNNIWADSGDTEVEYRADTKLYIQKKITEAVSALT